MTTYAGIDIFVLFESYNALSRESISDIRMLTALL